MHFNPYDHARSDDPATSLNAAKSMRNAAKPLMRQLLLTFVSGEERTAHEAAAIAGVDPWAASKRVSDLKRQGFLMPTGDERIGPSGRLGQVLRITDEGKRELL